MVEHDKEMMEAADFIVDIGPGAGRHGGQIVFAGTYAEMLQSDTVTAGYLNGKRNIEIPVKTRIGNGNFLQLKGAKGHNLKNIDIQIPLGTSTTPFVHHCLLNKSKAWSTSIKSLKLTKALLAAHHAPTPLLTQKFLTKSGVCLPACQKR